jgi:hypothetical protein
MKKQEMIDILKSNVEEKEFAHIALSMLNLNGRICEVGVREGGNFENLIKCNPELAVAVDCWEEVQDKPEYNDIGLSQIMLDDQYQRVVDKFGSLPNVSIVRNFSIESAEMFPDGYFDYVYIDSAHTYDEVVKDINAWYPKVKKGGILAGHDYFPDTRIWRGDPCGVYQAVNEFAEKNNLEVDHTTNVDLEGGPGVACTSFFIIIPEESK